MPAARQSDKEAVPHVDVLRTCTVPKVGYLIYIPASLRILIEEL